MDTLDTIIVSALCQEGISVTGVAKACLKGCAYTAITISRLSYLSDYFLCLERQNIVYLGIGGYIAWQFGDSSSIRFISKVIALVVYPTRCARQVQKIYIEIQLVSQAFSGYTVFPTSLDKQKKWNIVWFSPSYEEKIHSTSDYYFRYSKNLAYRCMILCKEIIVLIAFLNDFAATAISAPHVQQRNMARLFVNMDYLMSEADRDLALTTEYLESREETIQKWLDWFKAPINAKQFITLAKTTSAITNTCNSALMPVRGSAWHCCTQGVKVVAAGVGLEKLVEPSLSANPDVIEDTCSPFWLAS